MSKQKTQLKFKIIDLSGDSVSYSVDPNSIFINGYIPNWKNLQDFLFDDSENNLFEIVEKLTLMEWYEVELEIWLDYGENDSWIDYNIINISKI